MHLAAFIIAFITAATATAISPQAEETLDATTEMPAPSAQPTIFLPVMYYTPETKIGAGLLYIQNFNESSPGRISHLTLASTYTQLNQYNLLVAPTFYIDGKKHEVNANFFYLHFPNRYFGKGGSMRSVPEIYSEDSISSSVNYGYRFYKDFVLRFSLGQDWRQITDYSSGELIEREINQGSGRLSMYNYGLSLEWDDRDYPLSPLKGGWFRLGFQKFWDFYSSHNQTFQQFDIDLRKYIPTGRKQVLALQIYAGEVNGGRIPFQYLQMIGGPNRMRGYFNGRFRDKAVEFFQLEFRRDVSQKLSLSFFGGGAKLADEISKVTAADPHYSTGFGIHYILDQASRAKVRLDFGFGENGSRGVYIITNEAF